jgi:putative peptidoglycan lipid II flippase
MSASHRNILKGMIGGGGGTLLSRVSGLARDVVAAGVFGTRGVMDIFTVAFMVPNLFRAFFGEGALNVAFIPAFARELKDPAGDAPRLLNAVLTALAALLGALMLLGWLLCAALLAWGGLSEGGRLFCWLLLLMLPYLPLICLTAVQVAALNVQGRFFIPSATPALLNLCMIGAAWFAAWRFGPERRDLGVVALAVGVTASGVLQFAAQAWMLWRSRMQLRWVWDLADPKLRQIGRSMVPVVLGLGVVQINVLADRLIAQFLVPGEGANSALWYGSHLMQFPLGVLGIALATAAYPAFARLAVDGDDAGLTRAVNFSLRTALMISLPCVAVMVALAEPIVRVVFERGQFTPDSTARTAAVLAWSALGLAALCCVQVLARAFNARGDMRTPARIAACMVGLKVALNLVFVWPMKEPGLALASSLTNTANALALAWLLRRQLAGAGGGGVAACMVKGLVAAAAAGAAGYFAAAGLGVLHTPAAHDARAFALQCAGLAAAFAAAGGAFAAAAWAMGMEELRGVVAAVMDRLRRKG